MTSVLHKTLPQTPWMAAHTARLPGTVPMDPDDWLRVDEAFAGQMALRDRLIAMQPERVHRLAPAAVPAAVELYRLVLDRLARAPGYRPERQAMRRPDGVLVPLDPQAPLLTLGRLVQADLCLLEKRGGDGAAAQEHCLTGAVLCFPAHWSLAEKIGKPMTRIHRPVAAYGPDLARRVQRMFDNLRTERPIWRANVILRDTPDLFTPETEAEAHDPARPPRRGRFLRSERQCLLRLPETGAIVFSIQTYVLPVDRIGPEARAGLERWLATHGGC